MPCGVALRTYTVPPTPVGGVIGYYSCDGGCGGYTIPGAGFNGGTLVRCLYCPTNCSCSNPVTCITCNRGYYHDTTPTICPSCEVLWGPGCGHCDITQCLACIPDWVFDLNFTRCNLFYKKAQFGCCFNCSTIPNCATCIDGPICSACKPNGYFNTSSRIYFLSHSDPWKTMHHMWCFCHQLWHLHRRAFLWIMPKWLRFWPELS